MGDLTYREQRYSKVEVGHMIDLTQMLDADHSWLSAC